MWNNFRKYWYFGYLIILILGIFYFQMVLNRDDIKVNKTVPKEVEAIEEKFVNVNISVNNGVATKSYKTKLKNIDTVYDVFDEIRQDDGFYYEITATLSGTTLDCVNKYCSPKGYKWIVAKDGKDVTSTLKETTLNDDSEITLQLEKL